MRPGRHSVVGCQMLRWVRSLCLALAAAGPAIIFVTSIANALSLSLQEQSSFTFSLTGVSSISFAGNVYGSPAPPPYPDYGPEYYGWSIYAVGEIYDIDGALLGSATYSANFSGGLHSTNHCLGCSQAAFLSVPIEAVALRIIAEAGAYAWINPDPQLFVFHDGSLNEVPLPAALPLFATGLGVMGLLAWRRKRKAGALAAAA